MLILTATFVSAEKFFDMNQPQCKAALEIYKKFIARMERVRAFLRVAEVNRYVSTIFFVSLSSAGLEVEKKQCRFGFFLPFPLPSLPLTLPSRPSSPLEVGPL